MNVCFHFQKNSETMCSQLHRKKTKKEKLDYSLFLFFAFLVHCYHLHSSSKAILKEQVRKEDASFGGEGGKYRQVCVKKKTNEKPVFHEQPQV